MGMRTGMLLLPNNSEISQTTAKVAKQQPNQQAS
jgi:hypothetical protein